MTMSNNGLSKLCEEIGELQIELGRLQQTVGKMLAYGTDSHPDGTESLLDKFEDEAGDVTASIQFVADKLGASMTNINPIIAR